jgi:hypothetical protein
MPQLPSGLTLALFNGSLIEHGGNWFECPKGHFYGARGGSASIRSSQCDHADRGTRKGAVQSSASETVHSCFERDIARAVRSACETAGAYGKDVAVIFGQPDGAFVSANPYRRAHRSPPPLTNF